MRRRADSPLGPVTHDPQPSKRMRRESGASESRSPPRSANSYSRGEDTSPRVMRTASPNRPTLPPLNPLPLMQPGSASSERGGSAGGSAGGSGAGAGGSGREPFQSFSAAGHAAQNPSSSNWPGRNWAGHRSRHSIDTPVVNLKSPSPPSVASGGSERPRKEERPTEGASSSSGGGGAGGGGTGGSSDVVFSRDVTNRQPRSMMACMRCRRQKMKCDGPGKEPCRGCRQAGVPCVFESRTRPKSISTLPSRASPFFVGSMPTGRGGTPGAPPGGPSFYPATAQAAPPITSRPTMVPDYVLRPGPGGREPMPPPPPQSAAYPPPLRAHTPPQLPSSAGGGHPQPPYYAGPPPGAPGYGGGPPPTGPPPQIQPPPPPPQALESRIDSRLRGLETAFRSVSTLPAAVAGIQQSLNTLLRAQDALNAQFAGGSAPGPAGAGLNVATTNASAAALRAAADVPDHVWESYRVGAWPLTPWLPGISPLPGLPALLLACLGRRAVMDRTDATRREADAAADAVVAEVSRLLCSRVQWTRDEVLSLGVYGTWTADPALACLAVGLARDLQLDRPHVLRRSHDEWREWIYVVLTDHMVHLPNFDVPMIHDPQSGHWRGLVAESRPSDPSTLDRDSKLLAWLEYSELLIEVQQMQRAPDPPSSPDRHSTERDGAASVTRDDEALERERQRCRDIWRRHASKWEAWASNSGARHDPVLSLHFNYAMLYTASPVFAASERVWAALAQSHEGYQQLERGRDAALAVLQTLGSPEIGRTLGYSFPVLRPFFGLAIAHLVSMVSTLSHLPLISLPHIQGQLRGVLDTLADAAPLDATRVPPASPRSPGHDTPLLPLSLLRDMVESGQVAAVGKRDIVGVEPCRDLWRRIVG